MIRLGLDKKYIYHSGGANTFRLVIYKVKNILLAKTKTNKTFYVSAEGLRRFGKNFNIASESLDPACWIAGWPCADPKIESLPRFSILCAGMHADDPIFY